MTPPEELVDIDVAGADLTEAVEYEEPTTAPPLRATFFGCYRNNGLPGKRRNEEWTVKPNRAERRKAARDYTRAIRAMIAAGRIKAQRAVAKAEREAAKEAKAAA